MAYPVFPDVEKIVRNWLNAKLPELSGRLYTTIPPNPTYPHIRIQRTGGVPTVRQRLDAARIDVNVWGNDQSEAQALAQKARAFLMDLEGQATTSPVAAWVSGVDDELGLMRLYDEETNKDRYFFSVRVFCHAT